MVADDHIGAIELDNVLGVARHVLDRGASIDDGEFKFASQDPAARVDLVDGEEASSSSATNCAPISTRVGKRRDASHIRRSATRRSGASGPA